jgi:diadenylate cyclase
MIFLDSIKTIISWKSVADIALVAVLFYQIISMLKGTRAAQVLIGMLVIFIAYVFSSLLQFETLHWIISKFYTSFIIVVIVLFQDDIRRLLTRFGRGPFISGLDSTAGTHIIDEITNAAKSLSHERIGALIVFERSIGLDKLYDHSVVLDAAVSEQLLSSIFQSFSPLHDGAVIVKKDRINCASAQLPLSKNPRFSKKMGTRHSAAVGISEETDAVVLVISEETGNISIAWEGNLQKQSSIEAARKMLSILLIPRSQKAYFQNLAESKLVLYYYRFFLTIKNSFILKKIFSYKEKNKNFYQKGTEKKSKFMQDTLIQQTHNENKTAAHISQNVYVRFPKHAKVKDIELSEIQFLTSDYAKENQANLDFKKLNLEDDAQKSLNHNLYVPGISLKEGIHEEEKEIETNEETSAKNLALKSIVDLAPEDRFDPPLPKSVPPRDVSIGGIPLEPPLDSGKYHQIQEKKKEDDKK